MVTLASGAITPLLASSTAGTAGDVLMSRLRGAIQLPVGPRPPVGSGEPGVAVPGLGRWCGTRRRAVDHRGLHHVRDRGEGARVASGAITRCWPSPPAPATC